MKAFVSVPWRDNDNPRAYVAKNGQVRCDQAGKRCYINQAEAEKAMGAFENPGLRAYSHSCGYWHFGHYVNT